MVIFRSFLYVYQRVTTIGAPEVSWNQAATSDRIENMRLGRRGRNAENGETRNGAGKKRWVGGLRMVVSDDGFSRG